MHDCGSQNRQYSEELGVVEVQAGTRVEAVITAAGGATDAAVLASVNLAREAVDGEQIQVPGFNQPLVFDKTSRFADMLD